MAGNMESSSDMENDPILSDIFELSKTTTVEWLTGGDLLICRRKICHDGSLSHFPYEVYVNPEACADIFNKHSQIIGTMKSVKNGHLPNPSNMVLLGNRIVQCSVFNKTQKFGIHIMDNGRILRRKGLNLSPDEFKKLLDFFTYFPPTISNPKSSDITLTVTQYAWEWTPAEQSSHSAISDNNWHVFPEICFKEASRDKPTSEDYNLSISQRKISLEINEDLVDAAVGKLIFRRIEEEKTMESMRNRLSEYYDEPGNNLLAYGPHIRQTITLQEIFNLLLKVVKMADAHNENHISALMSAVMKRGPHPEALELMKKCKLNPTYVNILMDVDV